MELMFPDAEELRVGTEFGPATVYIASAGANRFAIIPRHGTEHTVPPHAVNYKANVQAMKKLGVRDVIATNAVGTISGKLNVGGLGLVDQLVDFSKRHFTFYDTDPVHVDMTRPYDEVLQGRLRKAAEPLGIELTPGLVYFSVDGPRYETAAEIKMFAQLGADVVGMTGAPETILSREAGLRYASLVVATNRGAGMQERVSHEEVVLMMERVRSSVKSLLESTVANW
jgi:5'-methylthioadenosine phosphorylase